MIHIDQDQLWHARAHIYQHIADTAHPPTVDEVPVVIRLDGGAATGIIGPREEALRLARWMIGQLSLRYSPADLSIGLLAPESEREWSWVAELPHSQAEAERDAGRGRSVIVVDATPAPAPTENVHVLAVAADAFPVLAQTVSDFRAVLMTPKCLEAFGVIGIEALACGTLVIAYRRGGLC